MALLFVSCSRPCSRPCERRDAEQEGDGDDAIQQIVASRAEDAVADNAVREASAVVDASPTTCASPLVVPRGETEPRVDANPQSGEVSAPKTSDSEYAEPPEVALKTAEPSQCGSAETAETAKSTVVPEKPKAGGTATKTMAKKPAARSQPKQAEGQRSSAITKSDKQKSPAKAVDEEAPCPSSKTPAVVERELKALKAKEAKAKAKAKEAKAKKPAVDRDGRIAGADDDFAGMSNLAGMVMSDSERDIKKHMFISFFREQYARLAGANVDMSKFNDGQAEGLSIEGGHRPMPRPKNIDPPKDFQQKMGVMSTEDLNKYGSDSKRMLISIHGDIFDVSDRPDKYSSAGPYWSLTGHDITWGLLIGNDDVSTVDHFYDIFKYPPDILDRRLQGIMSWWAFYEKEYGAPIARLKPFEREWALPPPPHHETEECCIM